MNPLLIIILVLGAVVFSIAVVVWLVNKRIVSSFESKFSEFYKDAFEKVAEIYEDRFRKDKESIHRDLEDKRKLLQEMIQKLEKELQEAEKGRIASFSRLSESIEKQMKQIDRLTTTTEALGKVLSNNQMRGQFGEQVADNLLKMAGFVKGTDYLVNTAQDSKSTRPDFAILLPDKTKINVDVKFPYQNLRRAAETNDKDEKNKFLKAFEKDVKTKIKQVAGREYINPEDRTVDFVILFIPNEAIFSYIYERMPEVWEEAMQKKVILSGPFSFTAILRMVRQAYDNFRFQKNVQEIIGLVKAFHKEFTKFSEEFNKLEVYITRLQNQFNKVRTTRTNQLVRVVDKIMLTEGDKDLPLKPPHLQKTSSSGEKELF